MNLSRCLSEVIPENIGSELPENLSRETFALSGDAMRLCLHMCNSQDDYRCEPSTSDGTTGICHEMMEIHDVHQGTEPGDKVAYVVFGASMKHASRFEETPVVLEPAQLMACLTILKCEMKVQFTELGLNDLIGRFKMIRKVGSARESSGYKQY